MENEIKLILEKLEDIDNRIKKIENKIYINGGEDMGNLDFALTLKEASSKLGIAQTTLKQRIQKGKVEKKYFRKTDGGAYLIHADYTKKAK